MSEEQLPFGTMRENDGVIIVNIPLSDTNIADPEQLEELKRDDPFFFSCQHYIEDESFIHIYYKRQKDYEPLVSIELDNEKKEQIAKQVLHAEKMNGTQYTTSFNPGNIYVNQAGSIKFAHRGIRSIIPPDPLSGAEFLQEIKRFLIYLYTDQPFEDINAEVLSGHENPFISQIVGAGSVGELKTIIEDYPVGDEDNVETYDGEQQRLHVDSDMLNRTTPSPEDLSPSSFDPTPPGQYAHEGQQEPAHMDSGPVNNQEHVTAQPKEKSDKKSNPLVIGLLGFVCGFLILYVFQVMPLEKEKDEFASSYKNSEEKNEQLEKSNTELEKEKSVLEDELDNYRHIEKAYQHLMEDETDEAISVLEEVNEPGDETKDLLTELYIDSNSVQNLQKALQLDNGHNGEIAVELANLDDNEASTVIKNMNSSEPAVLLEQAWLDDDYDEVISTYEEDLENNSRAIYLAAKSFIELEKPDKAKKLGEDLDNKDIQISALEKEKDLIEDDDDLDKDEREDETEEIDEKIEKLED